jgi:thioredoxin 1
MESKKFLYFSAEWCGPCKTFGPVMDELSKTISVEKINVNENTELSNQYNIRSVPTVVLVENGTELWRTVGVTPKTQLIEAYNGK